MEDPKIYWKMYQNIAGKKRLTIITRFIIKGTLYLRILREKISKMY